MEPAGEAPEETAGTSGRELTARWYLAPRVRPSACPDLEERLDAWVGLLGEAARPAERPAGEQLHQAQLRMAVADAGGRGQLRTVGRVLDLMVEQQVGSWELVPSPGAGCVSVGAYLGDDGALDLRRMHPLVFSLEVFDDRYVPQLPDLEPGRRNARRLGELLGRTEMRLGLELFGIEAPRFPRQACAWGFLDPHNLGRPC